MDHKYSEKGQKWSFIIPKWYSGFMSELCCASANVASCFQFLFNTIVFNKLLEVIQASWHRLHSTEQQLTKGNQPLSQQVYFAFSYACREPHEQIMILQHS